MNIFKYKKNKNEVIITGLQEDVSNTSIVIPETIDNMPVVEIGPRAFKLSNITDIKIGANIRKIGEEAFGYCCKLHFITWNGTCDEIPDGCFFFCENLKTFDFSAIKKVGRYAFRASGLQEACLPENIEVVSEGAFDGCSELHSVIWHCKCNVIPSDCFFKCSNLKAFDFSSIKSIGKDAFNQGGLQRIDLPATVEKVYERAFRECRNLQFATWNCKCDEIPDSCFAVCRKLKSFNFAGIKKIGSHAFELTDLEKVDLPATVESISEWAFSTCNGLRSVTWNCKCDVIPADCFYECTNLKQFDFSGIEKIGKHAFEGSGLQEVNLPENINVVLVGAFERCGELQSATWSHKCELIPSNCFEGCLKLTKFNFANAKRIGQSAFRNSGLQEVRLAKNIKNVYDSAFYECRKLQFVEWNCQRDVIPDTCFARCSSLKEFDLSNVRKIGERAFIYSGLTSVTLSTGTAVSQGCFACCNDLEKIKWLSDESIEKNIFAECKNIKEILISDKVMNIAVGAFAASPNAEISFV